MTRMQSIRQVPQFSSGGGCARPYDASTQIGAEALAEQIAKLWAGVGGVVSTRVEVTTGFGNRASYNVRSDLVGGLPRRWAR